MCTKKFFCHDYQRQIFFTLILLLAINFFGIIPCNFGKVLMFLSFIMYLEINFLKWTFFFCLAKIANQWNVSEWQLPKLLSKLGCYTTKYRKTIIDKYVLNYQPKSTYLMVEMSPTKRNLISIILSFNLHQRTNKWSGKWSIHRVSNKFTQKSLKHLNFIRK